MFKSPKSKFSAAAQSSLQDLLTPDSDSRIKYISQSTPVSPDKFQNNIHEYSQSTKFSSLLTTPITTTSLKDNYNSPVKYKDNNDNNDTKTHDRYSSPSKAKVKNSKILELGKIISNVLDNELVDDEKYCIDPSVDLWKTINFNAVLNKEKTTTINVSPMKSGFYNNDNNKNKIKINALSQSPVPFSDPSIYHPDLSCPVDMISLNDPITFFDNKQLSLLQNNYNYSINNNNNNNDYLLSKEEITNNINDVRKELEELSLVNNSSLEICNMSSKSMVKIKNIPLITEENDVLDKNKKIQQEFLLNSLLIELQKEKENYDKYEIEKIDLEDLNSSLDVLKLQNQMLIERIENSKIDDNNITDNYIIDNIDLNKNTDDNIITLTEIEILCNRDVELNNKKEKIKQSIRIIEIDKLNYYNQMKITDGLFKQQRIVEKIIIKEFNIINLKFDVQNNSYKSKVIQYEIDELDTNIIKEDKANIQSLLDKYDVKKQEIIDNFSMKKKKLDENTLIIEKKLDTEKNNLKLTLDDKDNKSLVLINKLKELDIDIDKNQSLMNEYYIKEKEQVISALYKLKYEQGLLNKQLEESIINEKAQSYEQLILEENNRIKNLNKESLSVALIPRKKSLTDEERNLIFQQLIEEDERINIINNTIEDNVEEKLNNTLEFLDDVANNKERYPSNLINELNSNQNHNIGFMSDLDIYKSPTKIVSPTKMKTTFHNNDEKKKKITENSLIINTNEDNDIWINSSNNLNDDNDCIRIVINSIVETVIKISDFITINNETNNKITNETYSIIIIDLYNTEMKNNISNNKYSTLSPITDYDKEKIMKKLLIIKEEKNKLKLMNKKNINKINENIKNEKLNNIKKIKEKLKSKKNLKLNINSDHNNEERKLDGTMPFKKSISKSPSKINQLIDDSNVYSKFKGDKDGKIDGVNNIPYDDNKKSLFDDDSDDDDNDDNDDNNDKLLDEDSPVIEISNDVSSDVSNDVSSDVSSDDNDDNDDNIKEQIIDGIITNNADFITNDGYYNDDGKYVINVPKVTDNIDNTKTIIKNNDEEFATRNTEYLLKLAEKKAIEKELLENTDVVKTIELKAKLVNITADIEKKVVDILNNTNMVANETDTNGINVLHKTIEHKKKLTERVKLSKIAKKNAKIQAKKELKKIEKLKLLKEEKNRISKDFSFIDPLKDLPVLHSISAAGDINTLILLNPSAEVLSATDDLERTPLFYSVAYDNIDVTKYILEKCPELANLVDVNGDTPLHAAMSAGSAECVNLLIKCNPGNAPNQQNNNKLTPAHLAVTSNCLEILYTSGAEMDALDINGRSPLFVACAMNRVEVVEYLINCLDENNTSLLTKDNRGDTPLHAAACNGSVDCLLLLLQYGIDPLTINEKGFKAIELAIKNKQSSCKEILLDYQLHYCTGSDFDSMLFLSALQGHKQIQNHSKEESKKIIRDHSTKTTNSINANKDAISDSNLISDVVLITCDHNLPKTSGIDFIPSNQSSGHSLHSLLETNPILKRNTSLFSLQKNKSIKLQKWGSWIAYEEQDSNHNAIYWYNFVTNQGQWEIPAEVVKLQSSIEHNHTYRSLTAKTSMRLKRVGSWLQYQTENGQTFYYNDQTGDFQWVNPLSENFNPEEESPWVPFKDPKTLRIFWYNNETKISQWESPFDNEQNEDVDDDDDEDLVESVEVDDLGLDDIIEPTEKTGFKINSEINMIGDDDLLNNEESNELTNKISNAFSIALAKTNIPPAFIMIPQIDPNASFTRRSSFTNKSPNNHNSSLSNISPKNGSKNGSFTIKSPKYDSIPNKGLGMGNDLGINIATTVLKTGTFQGSPMNYKSNSNSPMNSIGSPTTANQSSINVIPSIMTIVKEENDFLIDSDEEA